MRFIADTTWTEVFQGWRERETANPAWIKCATEIKGWPDWDSWRGFTASQLALPERQWRLYRFSDPLNEIPDMLVGPFSGWQSKAIEKNRTTFRQLLDIPEPSEHCRNHDGIKKIIAGLPFSTQLIGLKRADTGQIVCIEGHHRATAVSIAQMDGAEIDFSGATVTIALADLLADESHLLDAALERGTAKNPQQP